MSEPQLERSVLEAKEREELYAIADALGTRPGSRTKKADLIAQILRATGVEAGDAAPPPEEKPRRTRAKKAVAAPAPEPDGAEAGADQAAPHRAASDQAASRVDEPIVVADAQQLALGNGPAPAPGPARTRTPRSSSRT